jgi:hypothetical protein
MVACPSISETIFGFTLRVRIALGSYINEIWTMNSNGNILTQLS